MNERTCSFCSRSFEKQQQQKNVRLINSWCVNWIILRWCFVFLVYFWIVWFLFLWVFEFFFSLVFHCNLQAVGPSTKIWHVVLNHLNENVSLRSSPPEMEYQFVPIVTDQTDFFYVNSFVGGYLWLQFHIIINGFFFWFGSTQKIKTKIIVIHNMTTWNEF